VAGVDTHANTHHVAVLFLTGARLGDLEVRATPAGYLQLIEFIASFGITRMVGVEGTSSYGAGLARMLKIAGVEF
jgi:transposase